jgi:predicted nucleotide-binding protein (sugar kinase/HSP70/actin superfamily)
MEFAERRMAEAIGHAEQAEAEFKAELYEEGERFLKRVERENIKAYVGIGRDYVLLDPEASSHSGAMFSQVRGLEYIPQIYLERHFRDWPIDSFVENEFWVQSIKILKANLYVADHPNLFPIRMVNFACGPDSLKIYQEEKIQRAVDKPLLVLVTDAQTNNAPFVTRTEAHERVVNASRPVRLDMRRLKAYSANSAEQRTWLIPYMGDASYVGAAGLRYFGVDSQVLPTNTPRGYEVARKHVYTEVCYPLKGVVGDAIGFLDEQIERTSKEEVEKKYLVMLPTTSGPCRFGKYTEVLREFMRLEGLEKVPVVGPSSVTDYLDIPLPESLGMRHKIQMQQILFKGINAADLLEDILRRFRPYVEDKGQADALKRSRLEALSGVVERGARVDELVRWGRQTVEAFEALRRRYDERFPIVLYIGEIYMRQHDPYTSHVVRQLEDQQLEVVRDPITDWLLYVNRMNLRNARRDTRLGFKDFDAGRVAQHAMKLGRSILKSHYMTTVAGKIGEPFHEVLAGRHVLPHPMEMIENLEARHECHGNIEGESPLSTAIAYYFMHDLIPAHGDAYVSGIFHVGPFTCMQEGVATAKIEPMIKEFRKRNPDLVVPIIHAFFGDSPNANLAAEIAVFREQCYQKRELLAARQEAATPAPPILERPVGRKDRRGSKARGRDVPV